MIKFSCNNCGQKLNVEDKYSGKRVKCPKCGSIGVVPDNSDKIKFNCINCGQSISVPQIHAGKKGKCPKCGTSIIVPSLMRESPVSLVFDSSVPSGTDEDQYEEESDVSEEGVDRRLILAISGIAAVVVVGLIILITVILPSGPKHIEEQAVTPRQEIADTDLSPQPVTSETQPIEPIVQEPPQKDISPTEPISLEDQLYKQTKIAFASDRDGNWEIYVMNIDGSGQRNLTNNPAPDGPPSWSPDGEKIAFASQRDRNGNIYVMNRDGSRLERLTNDHAVDGSPSWSLDGKKITFWSERDGNREIYIMNADGREQKRLTNSPAVDDQPCWSPDGKKIAFTSERDGNREIYVTNLDGSGLKRLTNNPDSDSSPCWSSDGENIAFSSRRNGNLEIYVMNPDGSEQKKLTNNPAMDGSPSWSPDGEKIAFVSFRDGNPEIYVMNADGSEPRRLTNNPASDTFPSWSSYPFSEAEEQSQKEEILPKEPVSLEDKLTTHTKIAFASGKSKTGDIFIMNADGTELKNLTNNPARDDRPCFSPDGTKIAFTSYRDGERNSEIYVMNTDGSEPINLTNHPSRDYNPSWSGVGDKIAFMSLRDRRPEIYIMNVDGSGQTRITNNQGMNSYPCLSPDGAKIAFTSQRDGEREGEIYIMNADGSELQRLTNNSSQDMQPCFSPDGTKIAFTSNRDGQGNSEIYIMNADGSEQTRLTNNPKWDMAPCWSPDGKMITFSSNRDLSLEIYIMNNDGSGTKRLTYLPASDSFPSWSPFLASRSQPVDEPKGQMERPEITDKDVQSRIVSSEQSATDQNLNLKLQLKPKQKHNMRIIEDNNNSQKAMGQSLDILQTKTTELEFEVETVDANNIASIKVTYMKLKEKDASQQGQMEYDSTNPEISADNPFAPTYSAMIGQGFMMKVSPEGKILALSGIDEMYLNMAEKIADSEDEDIRERLKERAQQTIDRTNQRYGSRTKRVEALKEMIKKNPLFGEWRFKELVTHVVVPFSGKSIMIGDSWQAGVLQLSMIADEIEGTYALKEKNQTDLTIDIGSKIDIDNVTVPAMGSSQDQTKITLKGSYEGSLQIEQDSGWMIRKKATLKVTGEIKMEANQQMPQGMTIPISIESIVTVEPIE